MANAWWLRGATPIRAWADGSPEAGWSPGCSLTARASL
jgi:hypothetical protein